MPHGSLPARRACRTGGRKSESRRSAACVGLRAAHIGHSLTTADPPAAPVKEDAMSTTPDPASSTAATAPDEAEAVEATTTADAVEPASTAASETTDAAESDTASDEESAQD